MQNPDPVLPENFDGFVTEEIEPIFATLQQAKITGSNQLVKYGVIGLLAGLIIGIGVYLYNPELWPVVIALAFAGGIFGMIPGWQIMHKASSSFKQQHIARTAKFLGLEHQASDFAAVKFDDFTQLNLAPAGDRQRFSNLISGTHKGTEFLIYEAFIEERRTRIVTDGKGKTRTETYWVTVFDGQLLYSPFPVKFACTTIIARDQGWFNFKGRFGKSMKPMGLADPEFEKLFEVYTTDQVEGRFLVNPTFMVRLMNLETNNKNRRLSAAFFDQSVFVALQGKTGFVARLEDDSTARSTSEQSVSAFLRIFDFLSALKGNKGG